MAGTDRPCGCKSFRSCLWCENEYGIVPTVPCRETYKDYPAFIYCPKCSKAYPGWSEADNLHPNHSGDPIPFPGMLILEDFLSKEEANRFMNLFDTVEWELSQSGRRKQNFGPKANFKKRKLRLDDFKGFPQFTQPLYEKLAQVDILKDYFTVEQCSLEYDPSRGASIEPHIDDCWIWGERIVTVNLIGYAVLTLTNYAGSSEKYNLDEAKKMGFDVHPTLEKRLVRFPMPAGSLMVIHGDARYNWEHSVLREDVQERRVCIALRELTLPYLPGGELYGEGLTVLNTAKQFF